ncbi:MAG: hypothetical protein WCA38_11160 [Candidatus Acidiferrales bacterium]
MQNFAALLALLIAVTFMPSRLQAQDSGNGSAGQNGSATADTTTVTGCLKAGKQAGHYMLTAEDGTTYHLRSRQVKLGDHVGHTVEVTGRVPQGRGSGGQTPSASSSDGSDTSMSATGQSGASGATGETGNGHMLIVTSLKMVSDSCKTP